MNNDPTLNWIDSGRGALAHGYDQTTGQFVEQDFVIGLAFPLSLTTPATAYLSTNSFLTTNFLLANVKFFLTGDADTVALLQSWAPAAGLQISFDSGINWKTFSLAYGNAADPTTWILMPASAVSSIGADGQIGPFDTASLQFRLQAPPTLPSYGLYAVQIGVDCDVW
jgi:hypothetical protein